MKRCPNCNSYTSFRMEYNCGNPNIIYTCENCGYTNDRETYITDKTVATGCGMVTNTIPYKGYETKKQ